MSKKILIVGKSGSGKDYLLKELIGRGYKYSPKFTSRPKRIGETEGVEYNFISNEKFNELNNSESIKVYQTFNIRGDLWSYGISSDNFYNNEVFIMTPHEINMLSESDRNLSVIIYLDIDVNTRRERISSRNDNADDVERRINADEKDFENFSIFDMRVTNPKFLIDDIYKIISN